MPLPDWRLPRGVPRSIWEYAHQDWIAREDEAHLRGSLHLQLDERLLAEWLPPSGMLIDLGCGTGRLLAASAQRGLNCVGVDLSPVALRMACKRAGEEHSDCRDGRVALLRANLCALDCLAGDAFDAALLMFGTLGMIDGAENRRHVLDHAYRLLRPGGRLVLHAHNVWRHLFDPDGRHWLLRDRLRSFLGRSAGDTHRPYRGIPNMFHHAFSRTELLRLIESAGFEVRIVHPLSVADATGAAVAPATGWLARFRATGWIVLAQKPGAAGRLR